MEGEATAKATGSSAFRTAGILLAALLLIWLVVRNTAIVALSDTAPDIAMGFLPTSPRAALSEATWRGLSATAPEPPETAARVAAAARGAPLAYEPFFIAAVRSRSIGRDQLATRQMEEASRRNPRLGDAYLFLAEQYLRAGRPDDALTRIAAALRLSPSTEGINRLMRALYLLADDPKARKALARALAANPPWRPYFVQYASTAGGDPGRLFDIVRTGPDDQAERRSFLAGLIAAHDYERAYLAWVNFLPAAALNQVKPIYDGTFRQLPGPPPFNWELFTSDSGSAEMIDGARVPPGTALAANFFGSVQTTIASQTMLAPPGQYTLSIAGAGNSESVLGGEFVWQLSCLPSGSPIARVAFDQLRDQPTMRRVALTIPASCMAQTLTLSGVPGETSAQVHAEFGAISLDRR